MKKLLIIVSVAVLCLGALAYVATNGDKVNQSTVTTPVQEQPVAKVDAGAPTAVNQPEANTQAAGVYITYADYSAAKSNYDSGKVVYFFNAKWCPTCQALTKDITAKQSSIPAGVTLVSVDYDQYTDLKKQYGVTIQHTLVQVNKDGAQIKKWSGSPDLSSVLSQI